jgi:hypothetical protein
MKKVEYSRLSRGGPSGVLGSPIALLTGRSSAPTRSGGSQPSPRRGSSLTMSLKSHGMREDPARVFTDLESGVALVSVCLLVPLPEGSTEEKEVIQRIGLVS